VPFWATLFDALERVAGGRDVLSRILQYLGEAAGDDSVPIDTFAQEVIKHAPTASKVIMSSLEKFTERAHKEGLAEGRAEGRAEGLAEGRAEGRAEGLREALLELLRSEFGEVSKEHLRRVEQAGEAALRELMQRIRRADSIAAVFGG
jgi:flagellar biosynthesis/type III secretory pathway protein FliH